MYVYHTLVTIGDKPVELSELYRDIVPKYAARWRDLGVHLKIPIYHLDTIAVNNTHHPSYSEQCCKAVLHKWIQITPNPTQSVLQKAIDCLPSLFHDDNSESMYIRNNVVIIIRKYSCMYVCVKGTVRHYQSHLKCCKHTELGIMHYFCNALHNNYYFYAEKVRNITCYFYKAVI